MIEQKLQQFGLSEKEARVYAALQQLGTAPASEIAQKSGINRSTAYVVLDALSKRGLASASEQNGGRVYSPAPAEQFSEMAESSLKKWKSLVEVGRELATQFKKQARGNNAKPSTRLFKGAEGIHAVYETMLIPKDMTRSYSALSAAHKVLPDFFPSYCARRAAQGVHSRIVVPDTPVHREIIAKVMHEGSEYFLLPPIEHEYESDFIVSGNKVAFVSFAESSAFIVEDAAFAALQKRLFDELLPRARRWNVKRDVSKTPKSKRAHPALVKAARRFFSA